MRQTDARLKACICVTANGGLYMYSSPSAVTLVDSARDQEWSGWSHFNESMEPAMMLKLSINLGIMLEFRKGSKETLSLELWDHMCRRADDRRQASTPRGFDPVTGAKKRGRKKQNLDGRRYHIIEPLSEKKEMLNEAPITTRQGRKIYEFFVDEGFRTGSRVITEGRMKDIVNDRAEELRTKQDPWRIFCYYRPELVDCQLIKLDA